MLKKYCSILLMFTALAIMLGHNFIGHHHHDIEHIHGSHHHNDGQQHDNDTENEDWQDFFSGLHHGAEGITFLASHSLSNGFPKLSTQFIVAYDSNFIFQQLIIDLRQKAPPYISDYYNSQNHLPSGLRAPPKFIV